MLSRRDIEKELGKGINIIPLNRDNVKENSINLPIGSNAWTMKDLTVYWYGDDKFSSKKEKNTNPQAFVLKKTESCIITAGKQDYLLLLPHTTTIVETLEVIGLGNNIGGAVHSKVGIVAKGVGHIGTMLGPGYCGHLMVSLHNITDEVIALEVNSTFASLTFDYLNTQVARTSSTTSGHVDKFSELGIQISSEIRKELTADWKSNIEGVREAMKKTPEYKEYKEYIKKNRWNEVKKYINKRNVIAIGAVIVAFIALLNLAQFADSTLLEPVWEERFWNYGCSGLVGSFLIGLFNFIKDKK